MHRGRGREGCALVLPGTADSSLGIHSVCIQTASGTSPAPRIPSIPLGSTDLKCNRMASEPAEMAPTCVELTVHSTRCLQTS
ncbi:Hypothetical predicted protein [Pelobates cultripes]|uniref:Uncharacterized protein n=1 Tax=Pelobates cultripes TaxID=61616 RepID=A0AAD1WJC2_PELCU|nr:Hypothetical predicted protein [Pelobates cultripes]